MLFLHQKIRNINNFPLIYVKNKTPSLYISEFVYKKWQKVVRFTVHVGGWVGKDWRQNSTIYFFTQLHLEQFGCHRPDLWYKVYKMYVMAG